MVTQIYQGPSIVDYLSSLGQPTDFASRTKLASQFNIPNYTGTGEQNTELLNLMRSAQTNPLTPTQPTSGAFSLPTGTLTPSAITGTPGPSQTTSPTTMGAPAQTSTAPIVNIQTSPNVSPPTINNVPTTETSVPTSEQSQTSFGEITPEEKAGSIEPEVPQLGIDTSDPKAILDYFDSQFSGASSSLLNNKDPLTAIKSLITGVMDSFGLGDVNNQINTISKELEDLSNERDQKISDKLDNPWLTNTDREQIKRKITNDYENKLGNKINTLKLLQDAQSDARQQAQFAANLAVNLYQNERSFLQGQLEFVLNQAEKAIEAKRKAAGEFEVRSGPGESLYRINPVTGQKELLVPGKDDELSVTEKKQEALGQYSEAFTPGSKYQGINVIGFDGYIDPSVWKAAIQDAIASGISRKEFIETFGYLINTKGGAINEYGLTQPEKDIILGK